MSNILFIDDDLDLLEINRKFFTKEGYHVDICSNPLDSPSLIKKNPPDCIILDIMMPNLNGLKLISEIKKYSDAPVIFLSGLSSEDDVVRGLLSGAEDYIKKPYSYKELSVRISLQINKYQSKKRILDFSPLLFDLDKNKISINKEDINLSNQETSLLLLLLNNANKAVTYEDIGLTLWNYYSEDNKASIMVIASRLKKKLVVKDLSFNPIETVRGIGYIYIYKKVG
jgi:DNA-binding response OmpR family regulator